MATSGLSPPAPTPPPPRTLEGGDLVWDINRILAVRRRGRGFHYLVDWVGYGPVDRTWVPRSYLADPALLEEFYRANPSAIGRSPGVSRREGAPVAGAVEGAVATPLSIPAQPTERAATLLSSSELSSNTCGQSSQPTRAHQILHSGQKRTCHSSGNTCLSLPELTKTAVVYLKLSFLSVVSKTFESNLVLFSHFLPSVFSSRDPFQTFLAPVPPSRVNPRTSSDTPVSSLHSRAPSHKYSTPSSSAPPQPSYNPRTLFIFTFSRSRPPQFSPHDFESLFLFLCPLSFYY